MMQVLDMAHTVSKSKLNTKRTGKWKTGTVPFTGWVCLRTISCIDKYKCDMCECAWTNFVYHIAHPECKKDMMVGGECAQRLLGTNSQKGYDIPEVAMIQWLRNWINTEDGEYFTVLNTQNTNDTDYYMFVTKTANRDGWKFALGTIDGGALKFNSAKIYKTAQAAKEAAAYYWEFYKEHRAHFDVEKS
jgi:hypothetical protein